MGNKGGRIEYEPGTVIGPVCYVRAEGRLDRVRWHCCGEEEVVHRERLAQLKRGKIKRCLLCYRIDSGRINWAARRNEYIQPPAPPPGSGRFPAMGADHPFTILSSMPVSPGLRRDVWGHPSHA